jgi:hypothetical protein
MDASDLIKALQNLARRGRSTYGESGFHSLFFAGFAGALIKAYNHSSKCFYYTISCRDFPIINVYGIYHLILYIKKRSERYQLTSARQLLFLGLNAPCSLKIAAGAQTS